MEIIVTETVKEETKQLLHDKFSEHTFYFTDDINELTSLQKQNISIWLGGPKQEYIDQFPNLQFVQLFSAGANTYTWIDKSILLANAYGAYGPGIAEHMLAVTLMFQKDFLLYLNHQHDKRWERDGNVMMMKGTNVLSVGMGSIGTNYLKLVNQFGTNCYGVKRNVTDKPDFVKQVVTTQNMDELLPNMDVVALSLPETNETIGLFNEKRLRMMKKSSILINVGRGSAIVTQDLINVLNDGYYRGVSLDVTDPEPLPTNSPLWNFNNVQITPHISGGYSSIANYDNVINVVIENLTRFLSDKPVLHEVDRMLGY